jgi:hypothetical protein
MGRPRGNRVVGVAGTMFKTHLCLLEPTRQAPGLDPTIRVISTTGILRKQGPFVPFRCRFSWPLLIAKPDPSLDTLTRSNSDQEHQHDDFNFWAWGILFSKFTTTSLLYH